MKKKSSNFLDCFSGFIFLGVLLIGLISLSYLLGMHLRKQPLQLPLHAVYDDPSYQELFTTLDKEDYHVIHAKGDSDAIQMLQAYAISRNYRTVNRHYKYSSLEENIYKYSLILSTMIDKQLKRKNIKPTLWILHIKKGRFPKEDVKSILIHEPNHKIIVLTEKEKIKTMRGFTDIKTLPPVSWPAKLQTTLAIPQSLSKIYSSIYSVNDLFHKIGKNSITPEKHLGEFYIQIPQLNKFAEKVIKKLCEKGRAKLVNPSKTIIKDLQGVGIAIRNNHAYWEKDDYRINYILQKQQYCIPRAAQEKNQGRVQKLRTFLFSNQPLIESPPPSFEKQRSKCQCKCDCEEFILTQPFIQREIEEKETQKTEQISVSFEDRRNQMLSESIVLNQDKNEEKIEQVQEQRLDREQQNQYRQDQIVLFQPQNSTEVSENKAVEQLDQREENYEKSNNQTIFEESIPQKEPQSVIESDRKEEETQILEQTQVQVLNEEVARDQIIQEQVSNMTGQKIESNQTEINPPSNSTQSQSSQIQNPIVNNSAQSQQEEKQI